MENKPKASQELLTMGGHLEVLRKMLFRILFVTLILAIAVFVFRRQTFSIILAPRDSSFVFYRGIEWLLQSIGIDYQFKSFSIELISTDLSAQFMLHISTSLYIAILLASPYIVFELFRFISPALYDQEKKYSVPIVFIVYILFTLGILMTYFILFPFSFRFLGTYQVDTTVKNTITLSSYITTLISMSLVMGIVFQLPVLAYILGKIGLISSELLASYRQWALMAILTLSAIITPPDIFTLLMVALPLYLLYEISILIIKRLEKRKRHIIEDSGISDAVMEDEINV